MGTMPLNEDEKVLFDDVEHGDKTKFENRGLITAEVLRHIVVGLPLIRKGIGPTAREIACVTTGAGISIRNALIDERLELDAAIGEDGGPICPLEFRNCTFAGGFSGAHAHFSRLSFRECTFVSPEYLGRSDGKRPIPTIDLSGAKLDGDLDMRGIHPERLEDGLLWIDAMGIRVDGEIDLSRCHLRAPTSKIARSACEEEDDVLNLTLAEIKGDLQFLSGSRIEGRIKLRAAHIEGDLWLRGATIEAKRPAKHALFLQGARIDGYLAMDGGWDRTKDEKEVYREFRCLGELNLRATEIGRDLYLKNAVVRGAIVGPGLTVEKDFIFGADVRGNIDLSGCRIGGSLDISDLSLASSATCLSLKDGSIGQSLRLVQGSARYKLARARRIKLSCLRGGEFIETLWRHHPKARKNEDRTQKEGSPEDSEPCDSLPLDRHLVQAGFLRYRGRILHLDGHADNVARAAAWFGEFITNDPPEEAERVRRVYSLRHENEASPSPGETDRPSSAQRYRFKGGLILLPHRSEEKMKQLVGQGKWITERLWNEMEEEEGNRRLERLLCSYVQPKALLQGDIDLENLSCDMLDDQAGRGWSTHLDRIKMNHFVYHRTTWESPRWSERGGLSIESRPGFWKRVSAAWKKFIPSGNIVRAVATLILGGIVGLIKKWYKHLSSRLKRLGAELLPVWFVWLFNLADWLRVSEHWTPVENKRNWIYRQFNTAGLSSSSKYQIKRHTYRSQPFEQAIKVARAEGRGDYASYFEILKERIEWSIFISQNRGWFFLGGALAAAGWLLVRQDLDVWTWSVSAGLIFILLSFLPQLANLVMRWGFGYLRRPIRAIFTLIIAFLVGWAGVSAANDDGMLVIDLAPLTSIVGEPSEEAAGGSSSTQGTGRADAGRTPSGGRTRVAVIGVPPAAPGTHVMNPPCGETINEALYALDVLIPLIDLRQESRCEVGRATMPPDSTAEATGDRPAASAPARPGEATPTIFNPVTIWAMLKAFYAVIGWLFVSLAILTFVHVARARGEPV